MPFVEIKDLLSKEVIKGYEARSLHTGNMTLLYWTVEAGAAMPVHSHLQEQVSQVLSGQFELELGGEKRVLEPGMVALIPSQLPHGGRALTDCRLLDIFYPEREDYKFDSPED